MAKAQLREFSKRRTGHPREKAVVKVPFGTVYSEFIPPEYEPDSIAAVFSWARDLAALCSTALVVLAALLNYSDGWELAKVLAVAIITAAVGFKVYRLGYAVYYSTRFRIGLLGPVAVLTVLANSVLAVLAFIGILD